MIWKNQKKNERRKYNLENRFVLEKYYFDYTEPEISDAIKSGFLPFPFFEELNKKYESDEILFHNIYSRLLNKNRDDYKYIMLCYNIDMYDNEFDILTKIKGILITDIIEFVEVFNKNHFDFDIVGIKYYKNFFCFIKILLDK